MAINSSGVPEGWEHLMELAVKTRGRAHAPYSGFTVGCAIEDDSGRTFTGCNVENANYSETICAERTAIAKMVSEGGKGVKRVALISSGQEPCFPCGSCLQVLSEFGTPEVLTTDRAREQYSLVGFESLLPYRFTAQQLGKRPPKDG